MLLIQRMIFFCLTGLQFAVEHRNRRITFAHGEKGFICIKS